jgi:peptide deformylase
MADFVIYPDPVLAQVARPRPVDAAMVAVGRALQAAAESVQAYGLVAAHIGQAEPIVVVSMGEPGDARDYLVLFNPVVTAVAEETSLGPEGSVSMPGIEVPIARAQWCEIAHDAADGTQHNLRLEGFAARVAQHEIEQMNGVFFLSRVSRIKRDTALRKFGKSQR